MWTVVQLKWCIGGSHVQAALNNRTARIKRAGYTPTAIGRAERQSIQFFKVSKSVIIRVGIVWIGAVQFHFVTVGQKVAVSVTDCIRRLRILRVGPGQEFADIAQTIVVRIRCFVGGGQISKEVVFPRIGQVIPITVRAQHRIIPGRAGIVVLERDHSRCTRSGRQFNFNDTKAGIRLVPPARRRISIRREYALPGAAREWITAIATVYPVLELV